MYKKIVFILILVFILSVSLACAVPEEFWQGYDAIQADDEKNIEETEMLSLGDNEIIVDNREEITDTLPNMIYYNDKLYYEKESLFVFEGYRASQIADNYECIGYIEKTVPSNERPTENFSSNCAGMADADGTFPIYGIDETSEEFLTVFDGRIQVWYTEAEYNKGIN